MSIRFGRLAVSVILAVAWSGVCVAETNDGGRRVAMLGEPASGQATSAVRPPIAPPLDTPNSAATPATRRPILDRPSLKLRPNRASSTPISEEPPLFALGAGDTIKVTVWGYPELSEQIVILPDGTISYPLIGVIRASGLSAQGLARSIARALERHVPTPQVSIVVSEMRSRNYSVIGEVSHPGTFPLWKDTVSVLEAIAQAGGMTAQAIPAEAKIFRQGKEVAPKTVAVDLSALLEGNGQLAGPAVRPGDVVYIPSQTQQRRICVLGEVTAPGLYALTPKMTVIEAMSAAGWAKPSAVLNSVMVARRSSDGSHEFFRVYANRAVTGQDWSQHALLKPGDIVYVPKQFFAKVGDFVSFFSSKVEPAAHAYLRVYDATNPANVVIER